MSYQQTVTVYRVEERVPDEERWVLAWESRADRWRVAQFWGLGWLSEDGTPITVTHWHELPGPPQEVCGDCGGLGYFMITFGGDLGDYDEPEPCDACRGTGSTPTGGQS